MLERYVVRLTRPVAALGVSCLVAAVLLAHRAPTAAFQAYPGLWWSAVAVAAGSLIALLAAGPRLGLRLRVIVLSVGGLAGAVLTGNGLQDGAGRVLTLVAVLTMLALAVAATVVLLERIQRTPVRRL
ncbi:MAG TPA: hypothetical protein P5181_00535 [Dermatophilaceae bacterium]|nr:hypothetical protein [Dermatophilaceae bacterium]